MQGSMGGARRTAGALVAALALNLGWLLPPLGALALAVGSYAAIRGLRGRWSWVSIAGLLVAVWLPYLYVLVASGLTVGSGDGTLFSVGGEGADDALRAASGALLPLMAGAVLAARGRDRTRKLALASLLGWLVLVPGGLLLESQLAPDIEEMDESEVQEGSVNPLLALLFLTPFVIPYVLVVAAAVATWRRGWAGGPSPAG
jgi:hypothetical protein